MGDKFKKSGSIKKCNIENSRGSKFLATLNLLYYILPTVSVGVRKNTEKKKSVWRPSKIETLEGFLLQVKTVQEIGPLIEARINKLTKYGLTFQPFIIVVDKTIEDIDCTYVRIDSHMYQFESVIKAFDVCFKIIHMLNASYAAESEQCWLLILFPPSGIKILLGLTPF